MAILAFSSPFLDRFNYAASDQTTVEALIGSIELALENYLNRYLAVSARDEIYYSRSGDTFVKGYPITKISKIYNGKVSEISIESPDYKSWGSTATSITTDNGDLLFTDYTTCATLATALTNLGYTASSSSTRPSSDIVAGQTGGSDILCWEIAETNFESNLVQGFITTGEGEFRIKYTGGLGYPVDLQQIAADLVGALFNPADSSAIKKEKLAKYEYELFDNFAMLIEKLPLTSRMVLSNYRNRVL